MPIKFFKEPHNIVWIIFGLLALGVMVFFDYFKQYFIKIALIGILFILFYLFDDFLFRKEGKGVKDFFSGDLYVKRWKAFPIFLLEIYIIYFLSTVIENWLESYLAADLIKWWYVLIWIGLMFVFYWYKACRD